MAAPRDQTSLRTKGTVIVSGLTKWYSKEYFYTHYFLSSLVATERARVKVVGGGGKVVDHV